jgi:hypothetical protein
MCKPPEPQPSLSVVWANLRQPMPISRKLRLIAQNYAIRFRKRQDCCGHPGQPGC